MSSSHLTLDDAIEMFRPLGYEVIRPCGSGGFKQVFEAVHLDNRIALKVFSQDADFRAGREIDIMSSLSSPYIARVFDYSRGSRGIRPYISEEFISGQSLGERMALEDFDLKKTIRILDDILKALLVCEQNRIVHRDIKPGNIMLRENDQAILTDFGLARPLDISTVTGSGIIVGTIEYASPECLEYSSSNLDSTSDLFSLGITAYYMLSKNHPFIRGFSTDRNKHFIEMQNNTAIPISTLMPNLPPRVSKFIMKLIEKDRYRRIPSVEIAKEMLDEIKDGLA